jgi:hypothetical protein
MRERVKGGKERKKEKDREREIKKKRERERERENVMQVVGRCRRSEPKQDSSVSLNFVVGKVRPKPKTFFLRKKSEN